MALNADSLNGFTGTEGYHRWSILFRSMVLTDGAKYVADHGGGGAYWLMDAIASYQPKLRKNERLCDFQLWTLKTNANNNTAVLTCQEDSDMKPVVTQKIEHTDFDMSEIQFYVCPADEKTWVIMLKTEY